MALPDYQSCMLPLLGYLQEGQERSMGEITDHLASHFKLSAAECKEMLPSGSQAIFHNRVGWAKTYLKQAGLLETTRRGYSRITKAGIHLLQSKPETITVKTLDRYESFKSFRTRKRSKADQPDPASTDSQLTPAEELDAAHETMRKSLSRDLLDQLLAGSPSLFEKLVIDLLVRMGYGGNRKDAGKAIGQTNDAGIDGIIKEDKLGLDIIYVQAKRWQNTVSRPEIQKFAGALQGQRAKKGIFITTSDFSQSARDYVTAIETKIILIDGELLTQLLIDHNIGVTLVTLYEIKKIDTDYFLEG